MICWLRGGIFTQVIGQKKGIGVYGAQWCPEVVRNGARQPVELAEQVIVLFDLSLGFDVDTLIQLAERLLQAVDFRQLGRQCLFV